MPAETFLPHPRRRADAATLAACYVVVLMVVPSNLVFEGLPLSISPATLIAIAMSVLWLCGHLTLRSRLAKGRVAVRTALACYAIALVATYCAATYRYLPSDELKSADHNLVLVLVLVGTALLICDGVRERERIDFILAAIVGAGVVVALVGALQFIFGVDLTTYAVLPGLKYNDVSAGFIFERAEFRRVSATTGNPIQFGVLSAMVLPLALHLGFRARERGAPAWRWWVAALLIAAGLLFSVSRSAVLGIACAGVILLISWDRRRRLWALGVTAVFLGLAKVAFPGLLGTLFGLFANFSTDDSVSYRTHDYPIAAAEIARNPLLGRGVGTFYAPKHLVFDNQYLLTLVEGGIVGFLAMLGLFTAGAWVALRVIVRAVRSEDRQLAVTLLACLSVPMLGSITFDLLSFKTVEGILFVLLGVIGALGRIVLGRVHPAPAGDDGVAASLRMEVRA